jgi:Tfp pilus assembly protein PilX
MKKWIRALAVSSAAALILTAQPVSAAASFSDTGNHWAAGEVSAAVDYGYIKGYSDGTFKPENPISRAEFVTIINSAKGYTEMTSVPYKDVLVNEWYFNEVQKAQKAGYVKGDGDLFRPNAQITREEVGVILDRVAPGGNTAYELGNVRVAARISSWALSGVKAAYSRGYLNGFDDGNFYPQSPLKRGEAVKILNKVLGVNAANNNAEVALGITNINVSDIKAEEAALNVTANRDASLYWVVLKDDSSAAPSADQVINGKDAGNKAAERYSSRSVYANTAASIPMTGLEAEQAYRVFAVARDSNAKLSTVLSAKFTTKSRGETGEDWLGSTFKISNVYENVVTLTATSSKDGYLYWVIVADKDAKTPSQSNIKNGKNASGNSVYSYDNLRVWAKSSQSVDITGLRAGTDYKIFACVYESTSNSSNYSTVKNASFKTSGTDATWINKQEISNVSSSTAQLTSTFSVSGSNYRNYWMAVRSGAGAPTAAQIKSGSLGSTNANTNLADRGDTSGTQISSSSNRTLYYDIRNLTAGTSYYVYGVVYNGSQASNVVRSSVFKAQDNAPVTQYVPDMTSLKLSYNGGADTEIIKSGTYSYDSSAPAGTTSVRITPVPASNTIVSYGGRTVSGSVDIPLTEATGSPNKIELSVKPPGGSTLTARSYTLNITVEAPLLTSLELYQASSIGFSPTKFIYNAQAEAGASDVTIRYEAAASDADVDITSNYSGGSSGVTGGSGSSGSATVTLNTDGSAVTTTTVTIDVSKNGDSKIYTITITRLPDAT